MGFYYMTCLAKQWSVVAFKIILFSNAVTKIRNIPAAVKSVLEGRGTWDVGRERWGVMRDTWYVIRGTWYVIRGT